MRQVHVFGHKTFVDWAGDTVPVVDAKTGEIRAAHLFVAVLGASNYTFVKAFPDEKTESFLTGHVDAFTYFGGVSSLLVPDNLKTGVRSPDRYDPDLNPEYAELAAHYGAAIMPARVAKPRDKAKVEAAVRHAYRRILAPLRNRTFFSICELNEEISRITSSWPPTATRCPAVSSDKGSRSSSMRARSRSITRASVWRCTPGATTRAATPPIRRICPPLTANTVPGHRSGWRSGWRPRGPRSRPLPERSCQPCPTPPSDTAVASG